MKIEPSPDSLPENVQLRANNPENRQPLPPIFTTKVSELTLINDGMLLIDAAELLAVSVGVPASTVLTALKVIGFADEVLALGEVIQLISRIQDRLKALSQVLPNLRQTFAAFELAGALDHTLCEATTHTRKNKFWHPNQTGEVNYLQWLFINYPPGPQLEALCNTQPLKMDVLTAWWIYGSAARFHADQLPPWRQKGVTDKTTPNTDIAILEALQLKTEGLNVLAAGAARMGYRTWLEQLDQFNSQPQSPEGFQTQSNQPANIQIPAAIERLSSIVESDLRALGSTLTSAPVLPMPSRSERELLKSHWYFPRPGELKSLKKFLEDNRYPGSQEYFEAHLIGLSSFACRTVDAVLPWRVHPIGATPPTGDCVIWKTFNKDTFDVYNAPVWHKAEHGIGGAMATVVLPNRFNGWLRTLDLGIGAPRLIDLLPISNIDWSTRAYAALAKALNCSPNRAALIVRDLVPRLVYHDTANSALVTLWRSSLVNPLKRVERVALSHYIELGSRRGMLPYLKACKVIFDDLRKDAQHRLAIPLGRAPLHFLKARSIAEALQSELNDAKTISVRHQSLAHLVLFVCIAGTGHRRQKKPFPFPWDFNVPERLAFIADKLITGSEARFVPLAPTVIRYLELYAHHLEQLSRRDDVGAQVRWYSGLVASFLRTRKDPPTKAVLDDRKLIAGVFFTITDDGQHVNTRTISTSQLDAEIRRLTEISRAVQGLRSGIASHLWSQGASGRSIQAFLGHQPELHSSGPASTWSIREWADELEPLVEDYLLNLNLHLSPKHNWGPRLPVHTYGSIPPLSISSDLGYEGRQREKKWAEKRARAFIKREINEHILLDEETKIGEEKIQEIERVVREEMRADRAGMDKISSELRKQLAKLRQEKLQNITAKLGPLNVPLPGPVGIDHSRSLTVACVFRQLWDSSFGIAIGSKQFDSVERLAHMSISLVCYDAVLQPLHIQGLVESLVTAAPASYEGGISLRAGILSSTHDYNFSIQPGLTSSALAFGTYTSQSITPYPDLWKQVETRVEVILRKLLNSNSGSGWSLQELCLVYRPYWLIRLPGAMYATAIGDYIGPAADAASEGQLLGISLETHAAKLEVAVHQDVADADAKSAYRDLRKLFSESRGIIEKGQRTKKKQRAALKNAINSSISAFALTKWRAQTQIVDLLFTFIEYLLETGGKRVKILAFSSLEKYFCLVAEKLIDLGWDLQFDAIEKEDLKRLLSDVSQALGDKSADIILSYFASHLRDEVNAPYCGPRWSNPRDRVRVRSALVMRRQVEKATSVLQKKTGRASRDGALLTSLIAGYGVRPAEARGVSANRFDSNEPDFLRIQITRIADLKSPNGRRVVSVSLNTGTTQSVVRDALSKASTSPHKGQYLFEDSTGQNLITNTTAAAHQATAALRLVTFNPVTVPYHLRHTFGTALVLGLFATRNAALHDVATRILGSGYQKRITDILQAPEGWPFGIDAIAALMGQADITSLLNTYSHGSSFVTAAWCKPWQHSGSITDLRLAAVIGLERSTITKLRQRLGTSQGGSKASWQDLVLHLVCKPAADDETTHPQENLDTNGHAFELDWEIIQRILIDRLQSEKSLEEMAAYAARTFRIPQAIGGGILRRYRELIAATEMDDFEPATSELLRPVASHKKGVERGKLERDGFIATTQKWRQRHPSQRDKFSGFVKRWQTSVDAQDPRIVCTNQDELEQTMFVLQALGADRSQLIIQTHGDPHDRWLEQVKLKNLGAKHVDNRASRGSKRARVIEVSIGIQQKTQVSNQKFPDGRDFHRALIVISLAIAVENS